MPTELAVAQFIAYVTLTVSSLTVAIVSLIFAYRNNFGWKPLALSTSYGVSGQQGKEFYTASITFEVWNRRKYPLVLRLISVKFSEIEIFATGGISEPNSEWTLLGNKEMYRRKEEILEPTAHKKFEIQTPFKRRPLDDLIDNIVFTATYYDPRRNKLDEIVITHRYTFTGK